MAKNKDQITVYPAYAGVILAVGLVSSFFYSLSRIRGGDPIPAGTIYKFQSFIPHTRG